MPYPDFPLYLGINQAAIYGIGSSDPRNNIVPPEGFFWGTIYHIWDGNTVNWQEGDNVIFNGAERVCILACPTGRYTIIKQDAVIVTEQTSPPPP